MNEFDETAKTLAFDSPNSYVGRSVTRPNARRLAQGRGQYVDDIVLPRMVHVAYVRSPHAHARILKIASKKALAMPGVVRVVTGAEIAMVCKPYVGVLTHLAGMRSPPQYPLAMEVARWQGEPVVAVVAQSRAEAEDAVDAVEIRYEALPAALDAERALDPSEPKIHKELDSNLCFQRIVDTGGVDAAIKAAHLVVEDTIRFGRHTGVTMEPRAILADYNRAEESMTVYHCGQSPHMMQGIIASRLSLDEHRLRTLAHAREAGEIRRRPARILPRRHPCARSPREGEARRGSRRQHDGARDRRPHRHRAVLDVPEIVRGRMQPGAEPHGRPVQAQGVPRQRHGRLPEQEHDVPVPRGRPS